MDGDSPLFCGPLVRYTDRRSAVIWLELDRDMEVVVELSLLFNGFPQAPIAARTWPVQVGENYYAWILCRPLLPAAWYEYRIHGLTEAGERFDLWPNSSLSGRSEPSVFRTFPLFSMEGARVAFGSCRAGFPPNDPKALEEGLDALNIFAKEVVETADERETRWPHLLLFSGDQIYADNLSFARRREFARNPENPIKSNQATSYGRYAALYREAWTTVPEIRWMLSCIPSFMVFDDHDIIDDWNITEEWLSERLAIPGWLRLLQDGLLAYWIYQGAGNLPPNRWRSDERMRPLIARYRSPFRDRTRRMKTQFRGYVTRRRRADWGFSIDLPGTRFVVADTRMSRKLTGKRLIADDTAWATLVQRARDNRARNTFIVAPGPFLVGHPMHDLLSRVAESIEGDPPSVVGGLAGALIGGLVAGPVGAFLGAMAGSVGGEYLLDRYGEDIVRKADAELWAAFPSSFNRMLTLLEQLADGVQTRPKRFIGVLAGDVHHSNVIKGDLLRTARRASVHHFTMSPLQRHVSEDDKDLLNDLQGGAWYVDALNALERPSFVEDQRRRLSWYPLDRDGRRTSFGELDAWNFFGKFIGELDIDGISINYRYREAVRDGPRQRLRSITDRQLLL